MKQVQIKHLCTFFGDGDWIESKDQSESGIRLVQTGNIGDGVFKDRIEKARWISEETFEKLNCTELKNGDVLISRLPDPVGRACIMPKLEHRAITAVDCAILRFKEDLIVPEYFVYYSQSGRYQNDINGFITGSTRERISRANLGEIEVPLPSREKQLEIVKKLDGAFAGMDLLERNLEVGEERANQLLESILSSAFSSDENENGSRNTSGEPSAGTNLVLLGTVAEVIAGQSPEGIYYNSIGDGTPFYQGKKEFGDKFLGAPTTWTTKVTKLAQPGDILMSVRAPVGPINFTAQEICIGRGLASIRVSKSIDRDFLYYFLLHKQPEISGNTGAVFDSINKEQIASIKILLPSLEKQKKMVEKFNSAFAQVELLKVQIRTKKDYANELRRSLLSGAFTQEESVA
jgi:type I restriction enzyme S subunit